MYVLAMHRVGLFGGTFNPIHFGHLRAAEEVREALTLDRVWFVPALDPPHKEGGHIIPIAHRMAMTQLSVCGQTRFAVSDFEASRPEKSYSLYTIRHFRQLLGGETEVYFILGTDAFAEITTWHEWEAVLAESNFAVMTRPGNELVGLEEALPPALAAEYQQREPGRFGRGQTEIVFVPITQLAISSSDIRRRRRENLSLAYLTPASVIGYIDENGLYRG